MSIKYWIIDVDGTMTDGGIYYDENGNELKKFCTKDAAGFFAIHNAGMKIVVLTGRKCVATVKRMKELKVDYLYQGVKDKKAFLENFMKEREIVKEELAYIGDDLNDLPSMSLASFVGCPSDSCLEVKDRADYISSICGGQGAVRDVIEYFFKMNNEWDILVKKVYGSGR